MSKIKPIDGQLVGSLSEHDQQTLFLLAVKINELVQEVNKLKAVNAPTEVKDSKGANNAN